MATHTFDKIKKLVAENNKSTQFSDKLIICLIWKESSFDDSLKNEHSSATGLMQMTKGAVDEVNRNTPKGTHFKHADMTDAAKNIQCGTLYLDLRIKWARAKDKDKDEDKDKKKGIEGYGTGPGYADGILKCEDCLIKDSEHSQACLDKIHK